VNQSNYDMATLPAWMEVRTSIRNPESWEKLTSAAIAGGFTLIGVEVPALSEAALHVVRTAAVSYAACDYGFSLVASEDGVLPASVLQAATEAAVLAMRVPTVPSTSAAAFTALTNLVHSWPGHSPIVTTARGGDLAAILFIAGLSDRRVHVSQVTRYEPPAH